ncbi:hypothetical protein BpHYR1_013044 [Brachionus plicatilis]|uniref:Uncharacterized protein n=1 Tax=Brachionus plicatilis TaxID=10195 RepID=A0A3M7RYJ2_BRAPC|nr:hypothetical protein BpHYR1_013044 [Brachionus plicatilis]
MPDIEVFFVFMDTLLHWISSRDVKIFYFQENVNNFIWIIGYLRLLAASYVHNKPSDGSGCRDHNLIMMVNQNCKRNSHLFFFKTLHFLHSVSKLRKNTTNLSFGQKLEDSFHFTCYFDHWIIIMNFRKFQTI